jgi:hypothetical protein
MQQIGGRSGAFQGAEEALTTSLLPFAGGNYGGGMKTTTSIVIIPTFLVTPSSYVNDRQSSAGRLAGTIDMPRPWTWLVGGGGVGGGGGGCGGGTKTTTSIVAILTFLVTPSSYIVDRRSRCSPSHPSHMRRDAANWGKVRGVPRS